LLEPRYPSSIFFSFPPRPDAVPPSLFFFVDVPEVGRLLYRGFFFLNSGTFAGVGFPRFFFFFFFPHAPLISSSLRRLSPPRCRRLFPVLLRFIPVTPWRSRFLLGTNWRLRFSTFHRSPFFRGKSRFPTRPWSFPLADKLPPHALADVPFPLAAPQFLF